MKRFLLFLLACGPDTSTSIRTGIHPENDVMASVDPLSGPWSLAQGNRWRFDRTTIAVTGADGEGATLDGLFRERRWLRYQGSEMQVRDESSQTWSAFLRFGAREGERYVVTLDQSPCGTYEALVKSHDGVVDTPIGRFVGASIFELRFLPPDNARCFVGPAFVSLAVVNGVGPVAIDRNGNGFGELLTEAYVDGEAYPPAAVSPSHDVSRDGATLTLLATVTRGAMSCSKHTCATGTCCHRCFAPFMAGEMTLRAGKKMQFGCSGSECESSCQPLELGAIYRLTGRVTAGGDVLDVQLIR